MTIKPQLTSNVGNGLHLNTHRRVGHLRRCLRYPTLLLDVRLVGGRTPEPGTPTKCTRHQEIWRQHKRDCTSFAHHITHTAMFLTLQLIRMYSFPCNIKRRKFVAVKSTHEHQSSKKEFYLVSAGVMWYHVSAFFYLKSFVLSCKTPPHATIPCKCELSTNVCAIKWGCVYTYVLNRVYPFEK